MDASKLPIIDAEFEVVREARTPRRLTTWTFWEDDFPAICERVGAILAAMAVWWFFRAIHWFG